jgi:hypothetical protein
VAGAANVAVCATAVIEGEDTVDGVVGVAPEVKQRAPQSSHPCQYLNASESS